MKKSRGNSGHQQKHHSDLGNGGYGSSARLPSDYSLPAIAIRGNLENTNLSTLSDYQMTVRTTIELTRYQISMLLSMVCYQVIHVGIDFVSWLTIEYLFSRLLGSRKVWEIRDSNERKVLTLANIILLSTLNDWVSLGTYTDLPESIREFVFSSGMVMSDRTYESRKEFWNPARFIEVRAVPLDVFLEREKSTSRYSSYCKGYGESSRLGRRLKTRPSAELDGETEDRPEVEVPLIEISKFLYLFQLELRRKFERKR